MKLSCLIGSNQGGNNITLKGLPVTVRHLYFFLWFILYDLDHLIMKHLFICLSSLLP